MAQNGKILTLVQAAEFLQVSKPTLYKWLALNKIPAYKVEGHWRFFEDELRQWIQAHKRD